MSNPRKPISISISKKDDLLLSIGKMAGFRGAGECDGGMASGDVIKLPL